LKERMEIMDQKGINQWWNEQMMSDYFEQVFDKTSRLRYELKQHACLLHPSSRKVQVQLYRGNYTKRTNGLDYLPTHLTLTAAAQ